MNYLIQKMFENRGYDAEFLSNYNNPQHGILKDIGSLVKELHEVHMNGEHLTILPDFDMDGISSGTLGFAGFSELGFDVSLFIPDPSDGYGFDVSVIDRLLTEYPDTKAIITCDTGIGEAEAVKYCKECGLKVFITDHHIQQAVIPADIIVDPLRLDESYEHPHICGAYVLYQVLEHYAKTYCSSFVVSQIERLKLFAGIGTISDSMLLLYENRQLVRDSISVSRLLYDVTGPSSIISNMLGCEVYRKAFYGMSLIIYKFVELGKIKSISDINEEFYGYYMAPMFNSVKRMDGDLSRAFGIFFGNNPAEDVDYLVKLNEDRKKMVQDAYDDMMQKPQPYEPFIYFSDASAGVVGLLATKIMNETGMPTLVLRPDGLAYRGSGRSPAWYPFISSVAGLGIFASGHDVAFGIGLKNEAEVIALDNFLRIDVPVKYAEAEVIEVPYDFVIGVDGDGDIDIDIPMFTEYLYELETLRPFGNGFESPRVLLTFSKPSSSWKAMGKSLQHLRISLPGHFDVVCFNQGNLVHLPDTVDKFQVAGHLDFNEFMGNTSVQFMGSVITE